MTTYMIETPDGVKFGLITFDKTLAENSENKEGVGTWLDKTYGPAYEIIKKYNTPNTYNFCSFKQSCKFHVKINSHNKTFRVC